MLILMVVLFYVKIAKYLPLVCNDYYYFYEHFYSNNNYIIIIKIINSHLYNYVIYE